jgi:two-component system, chemotaxis family, CheB/CheR fusion protein
VRFPLLRETGSVAVSAPLTPQLNVFSRTSFLVLDDSEDSIAMMAELLKLAGGRVVTATNGVDALRLASENEFDVILSDISMPEMDGFEFLARLRKIEGRQDVPVVAITGFGRSDDIERARAAGFYSHLTKPIDLLALTDVVERLAEEKRSMGDTDVDYDVSAGPVC